MTTTYPSRLSVSALRDYHQCPKRFYFKRVLRIEEPTSPSAVYGTIVHLSFYHAYGFPSPGPEGVHWTLTGGFDPRFALEVYDRLTGREKWDAPKDGHEELLFSLAPALTDLNIGKGRTKSMQGREGWTAHFRSMLERSLQQPLPAPLAIEQEVRYSMGGVEMLGYIDMVLEGSEGPVLLDLKTGYNAPSESELRLNDQIARYYVAVPEAKDFWLYHMRSGNIYKVPRNDRLIDFLTQTDRLVYDLIHSDIPEEVKFAPRFGEHCAYCPFQSRCFGGEL
ncbi:RecB family exonuclease [Thermus phage G20c]|nr:RecB family exonuclease [Thermus phage G20c]